MIPQILDALTDLGKIGAQINKDELDALTKLNPGVDDPDVQGLLAGMSLSIVRPIPKIKFKTVKSVRIEPYHMSKLYSHGKEQYYFAYGKELGIPLDITTPKPLPTGVVQFIAMRMDNEVVFEHKTAFSGGEGLITAIPTVPAYKADDMVPGESYKLLVCVVWKSTSGKKLGAEMTLPIAVAEELVYDRLGNAVAKFDTVANGNFAGKDPFFYRAWAGRFSEEVKRFEFHFTFYYKGDHTSSHNRKLPTKNSLEADRPYKMVGEVSASQTLSLEVLNQVTPPEMQTHSGQAIQFRKMNGNLKALKNEDFASTLQYAARGRIKIKGMPDTVASLYVYPEFEIKEVIFKSPGQVVSNG